MIEAAIDFIMASPLYRFVALAILTCASSIVMVGLISIVEAIHQAIKY
tara:strand:- start:921 stop:1064 length:144 start_codon:yes stop_codon:yes gene_type:complete